MHSYLFPRAFARILALGACAVGLSAVVASGAQAATNPDVQAACVDARDGVNVNGQQMTEFADPQHNDPLAQATYIEAQRGRTNPDAQGNNNLSGIIYSTPQGAGQANCRVIYTARNGFLIYDHVDIYYTIHYEAGYVPTVFSTFARSCYTDYPSAQTPFGCAL